MRVSTLVTIGVALLLVTPAVAQWPVGHATAVGGYAPTLLSGPLWLGNPDFGYHLLGAPPGGQALLVLSLQRFDQVTLGLQVYPSLAGADLIALEAMTVDAMGRTFFPRALPTTEIPSLVGIDLYAQAAVTDPSSPGALGVTQGLLCEIVLHPLLAFANYQTGLALIDPLFGTAAPIPAVAAVSSSQDGVFANGGRDLFLATGNGLLRSDTLQPSPQIDATIPGSWSALAWDRVHDRLYALQQGLLAVIDGNRSSPAFGSVILQTTHSANSLAISGDGSVLALGGYAGNLVRLDADPASAGYLQTLPTPPSPIVFGFGTLVGPVSLSPDGRVASIPVTTAIGTAVTTLHRYDALLGQWIDHDPVTPGTQPLSAATDPLIPLSFSYFPTRDGTAAWLVGTTTVVRIDVQLSSPATVVSSPTPVPVPTLFRNYVGLSPSGRFLVEREALPLGPPAPNTISLVEVSSGLRFPVATLAGVANSSAESVAAWR